MIKKGLALIKRDLIVRMEGLEPAHLSEPDPKSGVSTNFTTPAVGFYLPLKLSLKLETIKISLVLIWDAKIKYFFKTTMNSKTFNHGFLR